MTHVYIFKLQFILLYEGEGEGEGKGKGEGEGYVSALVECTILYVRFLTMPRHAMPCHAIPCHTMP